MPVEDCADDGVSAAVNGRGTTGNVLLGLDGSSSSMRALDYAVGTASRLQARLLALYVRPRVLPALPDQATLEAYLKEQEALIGELRSEVALSCSGAGVPHEFVVARGEPFTELRRLGRAEGVDAVVIGIPMRARHRILPSVASRLVRRASWPVTVVP